MSGPVDDYVNSGGKLRTFVEKAITYGYVSYVRPHTPMTCQVSYNGVIINRCRKLFDSLYLYDGGWDPYSHNVHYETAINRRLRQYGEHGDDIVIVGGGLGTSTVVSARQVGRDGTVTTFEGSREMVRNVQMSAKLNDVSNRVDVCHAVVSKAVSLRGESQGADIVAPKELPECDIIELDCEGAEKDIIREMEICPRIIIVETHGMHDTPTEEVIKVLKDVGYTIRTVEIAEDWSPAEAYCTENGIDVVTAVSDQRV